MTQAGIAPPSLSAWRALAQAALKGAPFEALITNSPSGLAIAPLYTQADTQIESPLSGAQVGPWDARQIIARTDPVAANMEALEELQGGASSLEIEVRLHRDERGVRLDGPEDLARLTSGWMLDLAPLALSADAPLASEMALAFAKTRGLLDARFAFNRDPIGAALRGNLAWDASPSALQAAIAFAEAVEADFPKARALRLDARPVHEAGGSEAQEIGLLAASLAQYLRAGLAPEMAAKACLASLALGADPLIEIAKLRAARLVLDRVLEASGAKDQHIAIQAVTGKRMLTRRDPWINVLRAAASGIAGALGGADIVTILPLSEPLGQPDALARRLARNAHAVLAGEAHLALVQDPAAGAYAFEALTEELARAGWAFFQGIEAQGGPLAALASGWLAAQIAPIRAEREARVRRRQDALTGVSEFPWLQESKLQLEAWPLGPPQAHGLLPMRLAEPFERLRDLADAAGNLPVFLANLGSLAEFAPRAQFTANLLAAGGLTALGAEQAYQDDDALADAFRASGARAACLCGSDAAYGARAQSAALALKGAGCAVLLLAGRPKQQEAAWRTAGITGFIFAGGDAIAALESLQKQLGIQP